MLTDEQAEVGYLLNEMHQNQTDDTRHITEAIMYLLRVREQELEAQEKAPDLSDRG